MSNYKVKVNNEAESREVQEFLKENGYERKHSNFKLVNGWVCINKDNEILCACISQSGDELNDYKELTIPQLRDLVVLKRNSIDDATHAEEKHQSPKGYLTSDGVEYFWSYFDSKWVKPKGFNFKKFKLNPIEKKEMKEYLVPQDNGKYALTKATEKRVSDWVEVPEGANIYASANDGISTFWGDEYQWTRCGKITRKASEDKSFSFSDWQKTWSAEILWQRHTQPEELPFVDDESKSLNDTYAEIEQVRQKSVESTLAERQSTYGDFTSVANTTGQLMAVILNSKNGQTLSYAHEEALHMICSKIARIVNGNMNHKDSWHDISGYAKLIEDTIN